MTQINTHFIILMGSVSGTVQGHSGMVFLLGPHLARLKVAPGNCNSWGWNPSAASSLTGLVSEMAGYRWTVNWGAYRQPACKAWVSSQHGRIRVAAVYLVVQDPISECFSKQDLPWPRPGSHTASFLLYSMDALQDQLGFKGVDRETPLWWHKCQRICNHV